MPNVKLLLNEKVEKLGEIGEIVSVKPGYARNYLLPEGLATLPSLGEVKRIQKKKQLLEKEYNEEKTKAQEIAEKLKEHGDFVILAKAGEAGKLYGAITTKDISSQINNDLSVEIPRKQILLRRSIGEIGEYNIKLKLHTEVTTEIKIVVKGQQE